MESVGHIHRSVLENSTLDVVEAAELGQLLDVEFKERFADGHVDVYGCALSARGEMHGFVDKSTTQPSFFVVVRFGQLHSLAHKAPESVWLGDGLTVELVNPLLRTVGRNDYKRNMLIGCFSHSWHNVEQCRA